MPNCPICQHTKVRSLLSWKRFTIHKCRHCRLIFTTPLPSEEELEEYYQGFLFKPPTPEEIAQRTAFRKADLLRFFGKHKKTITPRFLDYGGGTGLSFNAARQLGWDAYYQDLDQEAQAFTIENFGLRPEKTIDHISSTDQRFDYILSDNVIEHVKDPVAFVSELVGGLSDGGLLAFKTPHAANSEVLLIPHISLRTYFKTALQYNGFFKVLKAYFHRFWHCFPPRHLYSFSKRSLIELVNRLEHQDFSYQIDYYQIRPFLYSFSKQYFSKDKRLKVWQSVLVRVLGFPFMLLELLMIGLKVLLLRIGALSPAGIILIIKKGKQ